MNNELMRDENFIRCSTMVAELLMKYKSKEMELGGESKEDSPPSFFACVQQSWITLAGVSPVTVIASEPCS